MRRFLASMAMAAASGCGFQVASGSSDSDASTIDAAVVADAPSPDPPSLDAPSTDAPEDCQLATISASKAYSPSQWVNGTIPVTSPYLELTLPATLAVTMGNAGNHCAELTFKREGGQLARCRYLGGASTSSPTTGGDLEQIQHGQQYKLVECREGAACPSPNGSMIGLAAGDQVQLSTDLTPITLRIDHGDPNAGTTVVEQSLLRCDDD